MTQENLAALVVSIGVTLTVFLSIFIILGKDSARRAARADAAAVIAAQDRQEKIEAGWTTFEGGFVSPETKDSVLAERMKQEKQDAERAKRAKPKQQAARVAGLGWSLEDFERAWGPARSWFWAQKYHVKHNGEIVYTAKNHIVPGVRYMIMGLPTNLNSMAILLEMRQDDNMVDVVQKTTMTGLMLGQVSLWDSNTICDWFAKTMINRGWADETQELRRGNQKLSIVGIPATDGVLITISVDVTR